MSTATLLREVRGLRARSLGTTVPKSPEDLALAAGMDTLDPWQVSLLHSESKRTLLNVTRQGGKSVTAGLLCTHRALSHPGSLVLILAPTERQAKETFGNCAMFYRAAGESVPADSYRKLGMSLTNGSRIEALPGSERGVRGFAGVDLLVLDEAARVEDELYYAVRPMLAVSGGSLLMMSTPHGKRGVFYGAWESTEDWERYRVPASECPRIPADFLEAERRTMPEYWFAQEYGTEFRDTEDQVFASTLIEAASGADVAATGGFEW